MGHRSQSAAPMDPSSIRYRGRSQSPTGHRSLSPPEHRSMPYSHGYVSTRYELSPQPIYHDQLLFSARNRNVERGRRAHRFHCVVSRFASRSATATPTGSPKKRQLPMIPGPQKDRMDQDLEERARFMRHHGRQVHTAYSASMGGECIQIYQYLYTYDRENRFDLYRK